MGPEGAERSARRGWHRPQGRGDVSVVASDRRDGDLAIDGDDGLLAARRAVLAPHPWVWARQVHGRTVVPVDDPGVAGAVGDALVTDRPGTAIAVQTADCAGVALVSREGPVAVAHAGWRGLVDGVLGATVEALHDRGADDVAAWLGPCIGPECYEFGAADLETVVDAVGADVSGTTAGGGLALDLPAAVEAALSGLGVPLVGRSSTCTACSADHYSHRARGERGRQAVAVWIEP